MWLAHVAHAQWLCCEARVPLLSSATTLHRLRNGRPPGGAARCCRSLGIVPYHGVRRASCVAAAPVPSPRDTHVRHPARPKWLLDMIAWACALPEARLARKTSRRAGRPVARAGARSGAPRVSVDRHPRGTVAMDIYPLELKSMTKVPLS